MTFIMSQLDIVLTFISLSPNFTVFALPMFYLPPVLNNINIKRIKKRSFRVVFERQTLLYRAHDSRRDHNGELVNSFSRLRNSHPSHLTTTKAHEQRPTTRTSRAVKRCVKNAPTFKVLIVNNFTLIAIRIQTP